MYTTQALLGRKEKLCIFVENFLYLPIITKPFDTGIQIVNV